jgi:DNA-binding winged helix-turn-helix (wHTH) protein
LQAAHSYTFGAFTLDTANRSLLRDGERMPLQPKAYEVLLMLIENRARLITRDELLDSVWGTDVNVEDGALNYQIRQLRSVLGDVASQPKYIRTIPKQGFQFVASVVVSSGIGDQDVAISDRQEINPQINPGGRQPDHLTRLARKPISLESTFSGHAPYVLCASAIYAAYFGVALLVEIAYQFDRYGSTGKPVAMLFSCFIFLSSLLGLSLGTKRTVSGKPGGLVLSGSVLVLAAAAALIGACIFLPAEPITEAKFQTFTAQAAYLKDLCYIVPLGLIYLVTPFHFVVAMERELRSEASVLAINLLNGDKPSASPRGTVFLRVWFLLLFLILMLAYSLIARAHLFDNLKEGPHMSLFQSLIHVRIILFFGLAILCLVWYYRALDELRRYCANRSLNPKQS